MQLSNAGSDGAGPEGCAGSRHQPKMKLPQSVNDEFRQRRVVRSRTIVLKELNTKYHIKILGEMVCENVRSKAEAEESGW